MKDLIKQLAEAWGPSGYEHQVRAMIRDIVSDYADEIYVDPMGNLICRVGNGAKKIMIAAHMDEIGLMATYQEPTSGYLRFEPIGGLWHTTLLGSRVQFEDGTIGVIGAHGQYGEARMKTPTKEQFFVDISDGEPAKFPIGQPAKLYGPVVEQGTRLFGRAMDDRVGCAVAVEAMRRLNKETPHTVYFVFTVQEELGLRGARAAAGGVEPDLGIAVDVTATGDTPHGLKMTVKLGEGAAIKAKDNSLVVAPEVKQWMVETADQHDIPYQIELLPFGGTDAGAIQTSHIGVPSGVVSIPCRYVHTISEMVDTRDVEASVALLTALVANPVNL